MVAFQVAAGRPEAGDMSNVMKQFTPSDRERISRRITALEKLTDAEVLCAVASESGRYDRAESLCGLIVGLAALISGNKIVGMGGWDAATALSLGLQVALMVAGFVVGSVLASYWHGLRRLFVSQTEMVSEVNRSVHQVFSKQGIGGTKHRGGMLIYLSLFERRLEVRCDRAVAGKIGEADLEAIRDTVLIGVRTGDLVGGLIGGLDRAEASLAKAFPGTDLAVETLSNDLLLFHPRP